MTDTEKVKLEIDASISNENNLKATLKDIEQSFDRIEKSIAKNKKILESGNASKNKMQQNARKQAENQKKLAEMAKQRLQTEKLISAETKKQLELQKQLTAEESKSNTATKKKSGILGSLGSGAARIGKIYGGTVLPLQALMKFQELVVGSVKAAIKMNKQLTQMEALSSMTNREMAQTARTVYSVSKEYGIMTDIVMDAGIEMVKMGASTEETNEILKAAGGIAKATGEDFSFVTTTIKKTMNQFKFSASQATEVADKLGYAVSNSAGGIKTFATALEYAGSTAKSVGITFDELIAQTMALADGGMSASRIGTSLRKIYTEIAKTGKGVSSEFERLMKMNLSYSEAIEKFGIRAAGAWKMMSNDMQKVNKLQGEMTVRSLGSSRAMGIIASNNTDTELDKAKVNFNTAFGFAQQGVSADKLKGRYNSFSRDKLALIADETLRKGRDEDSYAYIKALNSGDRDTATRILASRAALLDTSEIQTTYGGSIFGGTTEIKTGRSSNAEDYMKTAKDVVGEQSKSLDIINGRTKAQKAANAIGDEYKAKFARGEFKEVNTYQEGHDRSQRLMTEMVGKMRAAMKANGASDEEIDNYVSGVGAEYTLAPDMRFGEASRMRANLQKEVAKYKGMNNRTREQNDAKKLAESRLSKLDSTWNWDKKTKKKTYKQSEFLTRQGVRAGTMPDDSKMRAITEAVGFAKVRTKEFKNATKRKKGEDDYQYAARYNVLKAEYDKDMQGARDILESHNVDETVTSYVDRAQSTITGMQISNEKLFADQQAKLKSDFDSGLMTEEEYHKYRASMIDRQTATIKNNTKKKGILDSKGAEITQTAAFASEKYGIESTQGKEVDTVAYGLFGGEGGDILNIGKQVTEMINITSGAIQQINDNRMQMLQDQAQREIDIERQKYETIGQLNQSSYENQTMNAEQYAQAQYEAKKQQVERENEIAEELFEQQKKADKVNATASYTANLAQMAINVLASPKSAFPAVTATIIAANTAMMTAAYASQMSAISQREFTPVKYEHGGLVMGRSHKDGGVPFSVKGQSGYEMEGGEFVVNKNATAANLPLLNAINQGELHTINRTGGNVQAQTELLQEINSSLKAPVRAYVSSQDLEKNSEHREYVKQKASY